MKCTQCKYREVVETASRTHPVCAMCEAWVIYCERERKRMRELLDNPKRLMAALNRRAA